MSRRGRRVKLATNIYQDASGISAQVCVNRQRKEARFPLGTSVREIQRWQARWTATFEKSTGPSLRGTIGRDRARYERQIGYLAPETQESRRAELQAWEDALGAQLPRAKVTPERCRQVIGVWLAAGKSPKTVENRKQTLRHLYHTLDGKEAWTPLDEIDPLTIPKQPPVWIAPEVINRVLANLIAQETCGRLRDQKTRARFMVQASTGRRPAEIMRAVASDVNLARRVWVPRDAKGGETPGGVYLNGEMLAAWELFVEADAWGRFDTSSFAKVLRHAGWPAGVRPYNLRHTTWITASERGIDLADIQAGAGHRHIKTTRTHYVPVLDSRMQRMSVALEGRFGWTPACRNAVPQSTETARGNVSKNAKRTRQGPRGRTGENRRVSGAK